MYRNVFGDLIMTSSPLREATRYYNLSENLQEKLEKAENDSLNAKIEAKDLKEKNDNLEKKLLSVKIEHYKSILKKFIKTNRLSKNEHIKCYDISSNTYYVIKIDKCGKYWLFSQELNRYICETECNEEHYKQNVHKDYSLSDLKNTIKCMIESNNEDVKELNISDNLKLYRKMCLETENKKLKHILKLIDKVNRI